MLALLEVLAYVGMAACVVATGAILWLEKGR